MNTLLIEGFADTWRNLGAALRLFWPVLACFALMYLVGFVLGYQAVMLDSMPAMIAFFATGLVALIYVFFALCEGAVGWHRMILLKEIPGWISLVPRRRAFQYALAIFLFGLIFLIGHMIVASLTLPYLHSVFTSSLAGFDITNGPVDQLEAWRKAVWPIQIAMLGVAVALFWGVLWLTKSWLLILPHISIRTSELAFEHIRGTLTVPAGLIGALLVSFFLPSALALIYDLLTPIRVQLLMWVWLPNAIIQIAISTLCFLAGLSILSIAYRQADAIKVLNEQRKGLAQV